MVRRFAQLLAAFVVAGVMVTTFSAPAHADTAKDCQNRNDIKVCLTLIGEGGQVDSIKSSITDYTDADICGTLYVSKNGNPDWLDIPECATVGDRTVITWAIDHAPFDDGTVFCSQFVLDDGTLSGQPCVVTPIPPPPRTMIASTTDASGCATMNRLKQCIYVKGFSIHVDYAKGTEYGIPTGSICGYEHLFKAGEDYKKGRLCVPKGVGSSGYVKWTLNANYPPGTSICTRFRTDHGTWSGKPCEQVG